jgi:hypothetical protein
VCFVWYSAHKESSEVLHVEHGSFDAETWTLRKVDLRSFKVWMDNVIWTDRVRNEVLHVIKKREEHSKRNRKKEG